MPTYLFIISERIYKNILNGRLKNVITDRPSEDFETEGYIVELRSQKNNRIRYYTTQYALAQASIEYDPKVKHELENNKPNYISHSRVSKEFLDNLE